jgi:hypothetical protein
MNTRRVDQVCERFVQIVLTVILCLVGLIPLSLTLLSWFGWVAAEAPRPVRLSDILQGSAFFLVTAAWCAGIALLSRYFL